MLCAADTPNERDMGIVVVSSSQRVRGKRHGSLVMEVPLLPSIASRFCSRLSPRAPTPVTSSNPRRAASCVALFACLVFTGCGPEGAVGAAPPALPDAAVPYDPPEEPAAGPPAVDAPDAGYVECDESSPYYQNGSVEEPAKDALLWSRRGGWFAWDFCACRPDDTLIPADPRSLVHPDASQGRAVAFNVDWKDCHQHPELVGEQGTPKTCGELRKRVAHGADLLIPGRQGGGALFSGTEPENLSSGLGIATFPASAYNDMWKSWGLSERPKDFDFLVSQRVGAPFGPERNPYPLPGEDPNKTNGGSGQLPYFFTQLRDPDKGTWTGNIGITCQGCHSGSIGAPEDKSGVGLTQGSGSPLADHNLFLYDMLPRGYLASLVFFINLNKTRGVNNASDVNLAFLFPDGGAGYDFGTLFGLLTSGSSAGMDTPAWWNMGHRPAKFIDGLFPMDAPRVDMVFYTPITGLFGVISDGVNFLSQAASGLVDMVDFFVTLAFNAVGGQAISQVTQGIFGEFNEFITTVDGQDWMRQHGVAANDWAVTLKSPKYPGSVDTDLAEVGAVLFHELNLWDSERHNAVRKPEQGNGSCASCHGAYAPRYFNDSAYLKSPALEGMAGYITPIDIIGTDRVRLDVNDEAMQQAGSQNFFGYAELNDLVASGESDYCGPQNLAAQRGARELGYLAPPLYGVWATAPYFHNGSVPNLAEVLDSEARKPLWRRKSTPAPAGMEGKVVMGYDTDFDRAYDHERMGWQYDEVECAPVGLPSLGACFTWGTGVAEGLQCALDTTLGTVTNQHLACEPQGLLNELLDSLLKFAQDNVILVWNLLYAPMDVTDVAAVEKRKTYNTRMYGQGNGGHAFANVLSDDERRAILEYLKTL